ncbi:hypothetical protein PHLH4_28120 [Pseudomonas sp. St316]|nr:hypothetical protein PHLH4_28120 [Pseudomonas sp. St316]
MESVADSKLCIHPRTPVGASLLAKAPAHPASPQADPPLSRAGSLPQGDWRRHNNRGPPQIKLWELSLLAMTAAHSASMQADPPPSRASSLPQGIAGAQSIRTQHPTLWERACSRRRQHIQHQCKLIHHHREQARSHKGLRVPKASGLNTQPCGSEPAREDGSTANITASRPTAIASRLAPTRGLAAPQKSRTTTDQTVGAELARDDGGTFSINAS